MVLEEIDEYAKEDLIASVVQLYQDDEALIKWTTVEQVLEEEGISTDKDPRILKTIKNMFLLKPNKCKEDIKLNFMEFRQVISDEAALICLALLRSLVVRDFCDFACQSKYNFMDLKECNEGEVSQRDELYQVDGNEWCVSIVTVDGQKASFGNKSFFTIDELCGPFIHALAIHLLSSETVNKLQDEAPQNGPERKKDSVNRQTNGGTNPNWFLSDLAMILMCTMIKSAKIGDWSSSLKHDYVLSYFKSLCCGEDLHFSNASYSQCKGTDCKLSSVAHFLKAFAKNKSLIPFIDSGLDLLFQLRSMEITTDSLAMMAAILAKGGSSPFDDMEILSHDAVSGPLDSMFSGGLGNTSTLFAVEGGVPAICSESGAMLVVVPGVLGIGLYSPRVECCCSVRAYNFVTRLIKQKSFHPYSHLDKQVYFIKDRRRLRKDVTFDKDAQWPIFCATANGDFNIVKNYVDNGLELDKLKDSMGVTLLHVASAHGHLDLVKYIFCKAPELLFTTDKWCRKPSDYSEKAGHEAVQMYLASIETAARSSLLQSSLEPEENELK